MLEYKIIRAVIVCLVFCCTAGYAQNYTNCTGDIKYIGDGYCDLGNNNELCGYDGGDCCDCDCVDGPEYSCGSNGFACSDPISGCINFAFAEYPNCTGEIQQIGNGFCNQDNNNELCGYDGGDCCLCDCTESFSSGLCSNSSFCTDPNSDCFDPRTVEYPNCIPDDDNLPQLSWIGDGYCDHQNNNVACDFDGGDCCECTRVENSNEYAYDYRGNSPCLDPSADCVDERALEYSNCTGYLAYAANGICNDFNNNEACGFDWGDCCLCTVTDEPYTGFYTSTSRSDTEIFTCLDPEAPEADNDCVILPTSYPCPGNFDGPLVVENPADVSILVETVYCTGGEFEVEWIGHILVDQGIVVPEGTVLNVTGVGSNATIDGGGISRLFTVWNASLHATDIIIRNGSSTSGGAIHAFGSMLTFDRTTFVSCVASANGGALLVSDGSSASFHDTSFYGNTASLNGGALYLVKNSHASWTGSTGFYDNTANGSSGGAVYLSDSANSSWDGETTFSANWAFYRGGAVQLSYSDIASWGGVTTFTGNSAEDGGAVSSRGIASWTGKTNFSNNTALFSGGAVFMSGKASWIGETTFSGNSCNFSGGAVHVLRSGNASWSGVVVFLENVAVYGGSGGAVFVSGHGRCSSSTAETVFHSNFAQGGGGALYVSNGEVIWSCETLFYNNAANSGGALLVTGGSVVEYNGEINFTSNTASSNGGAVGSTPTDGESVLVFKNSTYFTDNVAGANGGGIALLGGLSVQFDTTDVTFYGNEASVGGGAVSLSATGIGPTFTGTRFESNSAQLGGGVLSTGTGTVMTVENNNVGEYIYIYFPTKFINCTFVDNEAYATGGAVDTASGRDNFTETLFIHNSATVGGALRLAGAATLEECSFIENISDLDRGPAVSNIGFISTHTGSYFSKNKFRCEDQHFLKFTESQTEDLYDKICNGCPANSSTSEFEEPNLVPQCISLAEAGIEHANSSGGLSTVEDLYIFEGYWRATNTSTDVKECYNKAACPGGLTTGNCNEGYKGPYCAVCRKGYVASLGFTCNRCSGNTTGIIVASIFAIASLPVVCVVLWYLMSAERQGEGQGLMNRITRRVPVQAIKIVIVAWQILTQFTSVANVTFPKVYQDFLDAVNVLNFDLSWVVSPGCFMDYDFYDRLLVTTIGPAVTVGLLGLTYSITACRNRTSETALQTVQQKHASIALLIIFFVYSNVSAVVFQTFSCDSLDDGKSYLRADYSIECDDEAHKAYKIYAWIMILVYPVGILALFSGLLFRNRHIVQDENSSKEDLLVKSTENLWKPYKPSRFYYEVVECVRRIMLTGAVVFIYPDSTAQVAITLAMAVVFGMTSEILAPYDSHWDAWINRTGHALIFTSMYLALLLKVDVSKEDSRSQETFSVLLVVAHGCMIAIVVIEAAALAIALKRPRQRLYPLVRTGKRRWNREASLIDVNKSCDSSPGVRRGDPAEL